MTTAMNIPLTVREMIDQHAQQQPERSFLITPEAQQVMTYAGLQQHARELAQQLTARGIGKGDKIAMLMDNGYQTVVLMLGAMYAGVVIVPMNAVAGGSVLEYVLEHSDARLLFVSEHYAGKFPELLGRVETIRTTEGLSPFPVDAVQAISPENVATEALAADDYAVLIYTSGTTGRPKGVLLSHKNMLAGGRNTATAHELTAEDRGLCVLPLYHINAECVSVMGSLVSGGSIVLPQRFSVSAFWDCLVQNECTWFSLVPTIVAYLLDHAEREGLADDNLSYLKSRVRFGRSASAPLSPEMHKEFEQRFAVSLIETMGLTETAAQILANPLPPGQIKYGSPGIAYGNEAKIIDEQGNECPRGVSGELMIRGDNVMCAYYKNEQATNDTLEADGWLHTGDLAMQDEEGYFFITGRLKELIIKGGENISPREIDEALFAHDCVLEAAAFGVPHRAYGQDVMACVVLKQGMSTDGEALCSHVRAQLGAFKAPTQIHIMEELPKGPSGKVQRLKLVDMVA
ncbi:MAG: AMP-binding protein [Thiolinea sp.]